MDTVDNTVITFEVKAFDGTEYSSGKTVSLTVSGINDAPVITTVTPVITALSETDFTTLGNFDNAYKIVTELEMFNLLGITDADASDSLSVSLTTDSSVFTLNGTDVTSAQNGVVQLTAADIVGFGLNPANVNVGDFFIYSTQFDAMDTVDNTVITFEVKAFDGTEYSSGKTVSLTVSGETDTLSGSSIDGYISNMTVFSDTDNNRVLDNNTETNTQTNNIGEFTLSGGNINGTIVGYGGIDISTGLNFEGMYKAPTGSNILNPTTSLLVDLMSEGQTLAQSKALMYANFEIDSNVDLLADPIASAVDASNQTDEANYIQFQLINAQINNTLGQIAAAIDGAGISNEKTLFNNATIELAKLLIAGPINLTDASLINILLTNTLTPVNTSALSENEITDISEIIVNTNTAIINSATNAVSAESALENLAKIQIAAEATEDELEAGIENDDLSTAVANSQGREFNNRVEEATIGSVTQSQASGTAPEVTDVTNTVEENNLNDIPVVDYSYMGTLVGSDSDNDPLTFEYAGNLNIELKTTQIEIVNAINADTPESLLFLKAQFTEAISNPLIESIILNDGTLQNIVAAIQAAPSVSFLVTYINGMEGVIVDIQSGEVTVTGDIPVAYAAELANNYLLNINIQSNGNYVVSSPLFNSMDDNQTVGIKFDYAANDGENLSNLKTVSLIVNGNNDAPVIASVSNTVEENTLIDIPQVVEDYSYVGLLVGSDVDNDSLEFEYAGNLVIEFKTTQSELITAVNSNTPELLAFAKATLTEAISNPLISTVISNFVPLENVVVGIQLAQSISAIVAYANTLDGVSVDIQSGEVVISAEVPQVYVTELANNNLLNIDIETDGSYSINSPFFNKMNDNESIEITFDYEASDGLTVSNTSTVSLTVNGNDDYSLDNGVLSSTDANINMSSLLDTIIESGDQANDVDSLDLTNGIHILSNLTVEDFENILSDSLGNTLSIEGDSNDTIILDSSWSKELPDTGFVPYTSQGSQNQTITLLIENEINVENI
jgi:hypothetical protein